MINKADEELMVAYLEGSKEAFHMLYSRYSSKVYGFVRKRIRDASLADDVYQNIFVKLHKSRGLYKAKHQFAPWLFVICRSVINDSLRSLQRNREISTETVPESFNEKQELFNLQPHLAALSEDDQKILNMRFYDECEFEDIADALGLSEVNVRQRVSRALKKLRSVIKKTEVT